MYVDVLNNLVKEFNRSSHYNNYVIFKQNFPVSHNTMYIIYRNLYIYIYIYIYMIILFLLYQNWYRLLGIRLYIINNIIILIIALYYLYNINKYNFIFIYKL